MTTTPTPAGEPPAGTVTFLFTDLEASTRLWEQHGELMRDALARHDAILRQAIEAEDGYVVKTTGDGVHAAFATGTGAVRAGLAAQQAISAHPWDVTGPLRVRMGIHTGSAEQRDGDYFGSAVNRAARLMAAGHGGQVLCSQATVDLVRDDLPLGVAFVDLGEHRLRDLGRPERVYQLAHRALAADFPPLWSLDSFPGNLPTQLTSFLGRDTELAAVVDQLAAGRLVTLTGVGGVGKTRLAIQAAAELVPTFPEGVWLCELAPAADEAAMLERIAAALNVTHRPGASLERSIVDALQAATLLLVLDNCEHLLDPVARFVAAVLAGSTSVRVLATSRELLGVAGEHAVGVRSLPVPDATAATRDLTACELVGLFVDRARAVRTGFGLDETNATAVAEICRRLDGIPLAIELAAARVSAMSPADIAGRLDERFRLLTGGRRTAIERHQTLRGAVDWSYSLLQRSERTVFDRLGVFAGSFDAAAAEAVAAGDDIEAWDVLDVLTGLVDKSIVLAEDGDGSMRYQLLETLRQYAQERLEEAGDVDQWRRRHAEHYAQLAETLGPATCGPDELEARRRIQAETDNFRAAVTWAIESRDGTDVVVASRIVAALALEATLDRLMGVGGWAQRLAALGDAVPADLRATVVATAGWHEYESWAPEAATRAATAALGAPHQTSASLMFAYATLGACIALEGRVAESTALLAEGLTAVQRLDGSLYASITLLSVAAIFEAFIGDPDAGAALSDQATTLARRLQAPSPLSLALYARGVVLRDRDPAGALVASEESLEMIRAGASDNSAGGVLLNIAELRAAAGDVAGAIETLREAVADSILGIGQSRANGPVFEAFILLPDLDPEASAVLAGAVIDGAYSAGQAMLTTRHADRQERAVALAAEQLGGDRFAAARARGAAMTNVEVLEMLRDVLASISPP